MEQFKTWLENGVHIRPLASQIIEIKTAEDKEPKPVLILRHSMQIQLIAPKGKGKDMLDKLRKSSIRDIPEVLDKWLQMGPEQEKKAGIEQILGMAQPYIHMFAGQPTETAPYGYAGTGVIPGQRMSAEDLAKREWQTRQIDMARQLAASGDREKLMKFIKGLYTLQGRAWNPAMEQQAGSIANMIQMATPMAQKFLGKNVLPWGQGHIAAELQQMFVNSKMAPAKAIELATAVSSVLDREGSIGKNFNAGELSSIISRAHQIGALPPPTDPVAYAQTLERMLQPVAAMRSMLAQQGQRVDPAQLVDAATQMASSYKGGWNDLAREMYVNQYYTEAGGAGGLDRAVMNRLGGNIGMSDAALVGNRQRLGQAAAQSPAANMVGALLRANPKTGPAAAAARELARGVYGPATQKLLKNPNVLLGALRVGNPGAATGNILSQVAENAAALTPAAMQALYGGQGAAYQKDYKNIAKSRLARPQRRFEFEAAQNNLAGRYGFAGGGGFDQFGRATTPGQEANLFFDKRWNDISAQLRQEAQAAATTKMKAPLNRIPGGILETGFDMVSNAKPGTTWGDMAAQMAGMLPHSRDTATRFNKTYGVPLAPAVPPGPPTAPGRPAVPTTPYPGLGVV
jgi:hypothetical protein